MKNQLRVLRAQRNWSQADLADRLEGLKAVGECDRDGQVRSESAAGVQTGAIVRDDDRSYFFRRSLASQP